MDADNQGQHKQKLKGEAQWMVCHDFREGSYEDCRVSAPSLSLSSSQATGEWLWSVVHPRQEELHLRGHTASICFVMRHQLKPGARVSCFSLRVDSLRYFL